MPSAFSTTNTLEAEDLNLIHSETITVPGIYRLSEKAYHADPAPKPSLSRSIAQTLILESPRHAKAEHPRMTEKDEDDEEDEKNSRVRDIGSAAHALLLRQPTEIAVLDYKDFKTKAAKAERTKAQNRGAIPLLVKDQKIARKMVDVARADLATNEHPAVRALGVDDEQGNYLNEVTAAWIDPCGDNWARCRIDQLHITDERITIIDYKTTEMSAEPSRVTRTIFSNEYHFQDAFYRRGIRQLFPEIDAHKKKLSFVFIVQEQYAPFEITVTEIDEAGRLIGEKMVSNAFMLWRKCLAENWWPGYPKGVVRAEMPAFIETSWLAREIEHPYLQKLGNDPVPFFTHHPYKPQPIMEPN